MEDEEQSTSDRNLIDMINKYGNDPPAQFFARETTSDSTKVRQINHLLFCIIDQLRRPINVEIEKTIGWIVYKQAAAHRHQAFFGKFRHLNKLVRRYNDTGLIRRLNAIYKRATNSGSDQYLIESNALQYTGCAFLRNLFILEEIQKYCRKTANETMGMLELEHWPELSLVIVGICAQLHSEVINQVIEIEKTYKFCASILKEVNDHFPDDLKFVGVVEKMKKDSGAFDMSNVDLTELSKLLKFDIQRMEEVQIENDMNFLKNEALLDLQGESFKNFFSKKNENVLDFGKSISREDAISFNLNETEKDSEQSNDSLLSPFLFMKKKKIPKQKSIKEIENRSKNLENHCEKKDNQKAGNTSQSKQSNKIPKINKKKRKNNF